MESNCPLPVKAGPFAVYSPALVFPSLNFQTLKFFRTLSSGNQQISV